MKNIGKILAKFLIGGVILIFVSLFYSTSSAQTGNLSLIEQLEEQIRVLSEHIENLRTRVNKLKSELGPPTPALETTVMPNLTRNLGFGARGDDVKELQKFLAKDKELYPEGLITGYFGPLTENAMKRWQTKYGIIATGSPETTGYGYVGPKTLSRLNELITEFAGEFGIIPPGLLIAPGIQKKFDGTSTVTTSAATTTSVATTTAQIPTCAEDSAFCVSQNECVNAGFYWYAVSCHNTTAPSYTCAASTSYCINSIECSANGWYWCRNSCYSTADACLGQTYVPPASPISTPVPTTFTDTTTSTIPATTTTTFTTTTATTTTTTSDTTPPVISNIQVTNITGTSATISWTTNEPADSLIEYEAGTSARIFPTVVSDANYVTNHSFNLQNLFSGSTYFYYIYSKDAFGNTAEAANKTFITSVATETATQTSLNWTNLTGGCNPKAVLNGSEYGVVWSKICNSSENEIYFSRFTNTGAKIGQDLLISTGNMTADSHYAIALNDATNEYAAIWEDYWGNVQLHSNTYSSYSTYFSKVDSQGQKVGADVKIATGGQYKFMNLYWDGAEYALIYVNYRPNEIRFKKFNSSGQLTKSVLVSYNPTKEIEDFFVVKSSAEYNLTWNYLAAFGGGSGSARLSANGDIIAQSAVTHLLAAPIIQFWNSFMR